MTATPTTTMTTGQQLLRSSTLLLNASYEVLCAVETIRAMTMLVAEQVVVLRAEPDRFVRSAHITFPWPTIVAMRRYVHVPHDVRSAGSEIASRQQILERDRRTCAYCGQRGATVDHILPQSRGGANTWTNLVTACAPCNNLKADRTPEEAGMPLLFEPRRPATQDDLQKMVWDLLAPA
ncbi:HNH endonuclease [Luteimicrobium subarcticum]|uniref:5-methylcytosine-specific restriction endonuclease McrA n=1 Tax=Luteimicrobium subarcticum TaxID=620910 RepID=A0A2M8W410_9MICO|nr:HNH endonuclease [Luteimicrobium subarcticum]PJI85664.1 5-methylcytosine-specific restriction endonuclease McrA [Luteimicrobium subarcticum]